MIDSMKTQTVFDVIGKFREYVIQTYGSPSCTSNDYLSVANRLINIASKSSDNCSVSEMIEKFYVTCVGVPAFDPPKEESKKL